VWWTGGKPWLKHFAFPVAFTLVAVPWISGIETPLIQGLMRFIAATAAETANLLGIPAQVQGNLIQVRTGLIGVNEACSGVRSLQTSLMIGLLFGELRRLSIMRRFALVGGAIAIALVANLARAVFLVSIGAEEGSAAINRWHDLAGYGIVALVFLGTLILAWLLGKQTTVAAGVSAAHKSNTQPAPPPLDRISNFGFRTSAAAIVWLLLVEATAAGWYRVHERDESPSAHWSVNWPKTAPGFREMKIDEGVRSTLRYDEAKEASWNLADAAGAPLHWRCISFFFRWNPGGSSVVRARAHRPDICLPAAGWKQIADDGVKNYVIGSDFALPFHHLRFADERGGVTADTFFCLQEDERKPNEPRPDLKITGGAQPDWGLLGRSRVVMNGVRNRGQQILEVVLLSPHRAEHVDAETAESEFATMLPGIVTTDYKSTRPPDS
jgi:exosortase/archaeosortase family protein